jgi:predicted  nucleic acid-binding Zn-ribbon protein
MQVDFQFFINVVIGIFTFFGGWILKTIWEKTNINADHIDELRNHHEADLKESRQKINDLALSLPEKYVNKGDFENLVKVVHHRFDRIEEKLDRLQK